MLVFYQLLPTDQQYSHTCERDTTMVWQLHTLLVATDISSWMCHMLHLRSWPQGKTYTDLKPVWNCVP